MSSLTKEDIAVLLEMLTVYQKNGIIQFAEYVNTHSVWSKIKDYFLEVQQNEESGSDAVEPVIDFSVDDYQFIQAAMKLFASRMPTDIDNWPRIYTIYNKVKVINATNMVSTDEVEEEKKDDEETIPDVSEI
jgi:hypothetical protein